MPFDDLPVELAPRSHLIPTHFLNSAIMVGHDSKHLFPVSQSSISLHWCYCTCILSCGCVGLSVRRYCCGFWYDVMEHRLSNSKLHYEFIVPHFWLLSFAGNLSISFQCDFVAVIILSTDSYSEFVCVGCSCDRFFVCRNGTTDFAKAGQVSDDTINLINY